DLGAEGAAIAAQLEAGALPTTRDMPTGIRLIIEDASAQAISHAFLIGVPLAVLSLLAIVFLPNRPLARQNNLERKHEQRAELAFAVATAETGSIRVPDAAHPGEPPPASGGSRHSRGSHDSDAAPGDAEQDGRS